MTKNYHEKHKSSHLQKSKLVAHEALIINQIADSIPKNVHMNLYLDTLFESYITYGMTVWGSMPDSKLNKLSNAQKKIMSIMFGDRGKFLDKFRTCTRARPYPEQNLPSEFYLK